ncbi:MAG: isoleucine--tRNA ligase [Coriobacteriia bacterium]|nr:isoleucine--tRNA ligase [Coriobacteriia bacterium]
MANQYKDTMNLPQTDFPMRANLAKNEPKRLAKWEEADLFGLLLKHHEGHPSFILHDGPPYANGPIHIGHALNKISKDIINRYWAEQGYYTPYVPGWDCHGQPIEHKIELKLGTEKFRATPQPEIREMCRAYALENIDIQRDGFKRLGVLGLWDDPYLTLNHSYEATDVEVFKNIYLKGAIYQGRKPVHWCIHCQTALAEAEIEYHDVSSPSIYVKYMLTEKPDKLKAVDGKASILIWTTTPWTLPANSGIALSADADYVAVAHGDDLMIMAEALVEQVMQAAEIEDYSLASNEAGVIRFKGSELVDFEYKHPTLEGELGRVIVADHVTLEDGTGAVHTAPGHGEEDYVSALETGLTIRMPVQDDGVYDKTAGQFEGIHIEKAVGPVLNHLKAENTLLVKKNIKHSYPHCWRCKNPIVLRATEQWFVSMDKTKLRENALKALDEVTWYPEWSVNRIGSMVRDRPDWTISRQRAWGIPLPLHRCKKCGKVVANEASFDAIIDLFKREGSDAWFIREPQEYLPEDLSCECGAHAEDFEPEHDILDVWWESGVSHTAVLENYPEIGLHRPADMYLEGSDQHRGWFQSSLLTSVGAYEKAPYKKVVSQGFTVDEQGKKMSKSVGNVIDPNEIADTLGAEVLRLWVASTDSSQDMSVSKSILDRTSDAYRRIRNTFRFLLSNLEDFNPDKDAVAFEELLPIDKWALARLNELENEVKANYELYRFHAVFRPIYDYAVSELSNIYMDALKDRLYSDAPHWKSRRSAQTVLNETLQCLMRLLQPILAFTVDEVLEYMPEALKEFEYGALLDWYTPKISDEQAQAVLKEYRLALQLRDAVTKALETARGEEVINKSQEANILISAPQAFLDAFDNEEGKAALREFFIVHDLKFEVAEEVSVSVNAADGEKCPRCWNIRELGGNPKHEDVCERCAQVLEELE